MPNVEGLSREEIEHAFNFDWDASTNEISGDEIENGTGEKFRLNSWKGRSIESGLLENTGIEGYMRDSCVTFQICFEKIDPKTLKCKKRPFVASESIWEDDKTFTVGEIKKPVEYFYISFDTQLI